MNDSNWPSSSDEERGEPQTDLPHELPPVEPPSAGLIVQLFLIPAIIVAVIIAVYAMFGQIVSDDLDWRQLTIDVRSENPHVRWRGALGLAQMLDADKQRDSGQPELAANPEIAAALSEVYGELIDVQNPTEEETKQIEFLSKALGRMTVAPVIVPVLRSGSSPDRDRAVRKHSLIGLAMLVGNLRERGMPLEDEEFTRQIIDISREREPLFRHEAAYVLGLLATPEAMQRLALLLEDPDQMVRVNAAIGFARNGQLQGLDVFHELLQAAAGWKLDPESVTTPEEEAQYFERMLMAMNTLKGISQLHEKLDSAQRERFSAELNALLKSTRDAALRSEILELRELLRQGSEQSAA